MPIGYGGAPRQYPLPAETIPPADTPEGRLMRQQAEAARRLGVMGFGGLLDRGLFTRPEGLPGPGLLQPVMFDRVRRQYGLGLLGGTEGGGRGMGGGGGRGPGELPLEGGSVRSYNVRNPSGEPRPEGPKFDWAYSSNTGITATTLPKTGVRVYMTPKGSRSSGEMVDIDFISPVMKTVRSPTQRGSYTRVEDHDPGTTQRGIERLSEVFSAVKDYVTKFRPSELNFTGSSSKHDMVYERVAPKIAEALGGRLEKPGPFSWRIILDDAK